MRRQAAGRLRAASLVFASGMFLMTSGAALAQSEAPSGYGATLRGFLSGGQTDLVGGGVQS